MSTSWGLSTTPSVLSLKPFTNGVKLLTLIIHYKFISLIMNLFENLDRVYKKDYIFVKQSSNHTATFIIKWKEKNSEKCFSPREIGSS